MRRALLLLVVAAALLAVVAGAVLAEAKTCTPGDCVGTRGADTLTGTGNSFSINRIAGLEGNDTITGDDTSHTIYGDEDNDTIDVEENNFGADTVNCGPGTKDKVFFDKGLDTVSRNCEIRKGL